MNSKSDINNNNNNNNLAIINDINTRIQHHSASIIDDTNTRIQHHGASILDDNNNTRKKHQVQQEIIETAATSIASKTQLDGYNSKRLVVIGDGGPSNISILNTTTATTTDATINNNNSNLRRKTTSLSFPTHYNTNNITINQNLNNISSSSTSTSANNNTIIMIDEKKKSRDKTSYTIGGQEQQKLQDTTTNNNNNNDNDDDEVTTIEIKIKKKHLAAYNESSTISIELVKQYKDVQEKETKLQHVKEISTDVLLQSANVTIPSTLQILSNSDEIKNSEYYKKLQNHVNGILSYCKKEIKDDIVKMAELEVYMAKRKFANEYVRNSTCLWKSCMMMLPNASLLSSQSNNNENHDINEYINRLLLEETIIPTASNDNDGTLLQQQLPNLMKYFDINYNKEQDDNNNHNTTITVDDNDNHTNTNNNNINLVIPNIPSINGMNNNNATTTSSSSNLLKKKQSDIINSDTSVSSFYKSALMAYNQYENGNTNAASIPKTINTWKINASSSKHQHHQQQQQISSHNSITSSNNSYANDTVASTTNNNNKKNNNTLTTTNQSTEQSTTNTKIRNKNNNIKPINNDIVFIEGNSISTVQRTMQQHTSQLQNNKHSKQYLLPQCNANNNYNTTTNDNDDDDDDDDDDDASDISSKSDILDVGIVTTTTNNNNHKTAHDKYDLCNSSIEDNNNKQLLRSSRKSTMGGTIPRMPNNNSNVSSISSNNNDNDNKPKRRSTKNVSYFDDYAVLDDDDGDSLSLGLRYSSQVTIPRKRLPPSTPPLIPRNNGSITNNTAYSSPIVSDNHTTSTSTTDVATTNNNHNIKYDSTINKEIIECLDSDTESDGEQDHHQRNHVNNDNKNSTNSVTTTAINSNNNANINNTTISLDHKTHDTINGLQRLLSKEHSNNLSASIKKRKLNECRSESNFYPILTRWPPLYYKSNSRLALRIIKKIEALDSDYSFQFPVTEQYPKIAEDYLKCITNPMDIRTIKFKAKNDEYKFLSEMQDDLISMFRNCCMYNGENSEHWKYAVNIWKQLNDIFNISCGSEKVEIPRR